MDQPSLLPPRTSTAFLRAYEQALAYEPRLVEGIDTIRDVKGRQLPGWLQFLLYHYGLIELTPYVPNAYTLLAEGRQWQIERDTFAAVLRGLGWVLSPGRIDQAPARRVWWNSFQIYLDSLPPADVPNLERIEKITSLSAPFRSDFRRGVSGYDAPAFEADNTRLDASLLDVESGVRLRPGGPLWSFGRVTELNHELTEAEGTALGNWIPRLAEAAYTVDFTTLTATVDGQVVPIGDAIDFSRASQKWHAGTNGIYQRFEIDQIAATGLGTLIEKASDRLSVFAPQTSPLDDPTAAVINQVGVADPFGGNAAIRVTFTADAGRTLLIPATDLAADTVYSVSFFARLISSSGMGAPGGDAGFQEVFAQLVPNQWVRVKGVPYTTGEIVGEWMDLTLTTPGASLTVELYGFQIEPGDKVTSPIGGADLPAHRAADALTLLLPTGMNNVVAKFDDGTGQSFLGVFPPFVIDPLELSRPLLVEIANATASTWQSMAFPWEDANFPWSSDAKSQREIELATWFHEKIAYIGLKDQGGQIIGYRRARAVRQVDRLLNGPYSFGGARYIGSGIGQSVFVEAMTDAGNGAGIVAKDASIIFNATLAAGVKPGALWVPPGGITGGVAVAATPIDLPLRATVRERLKFMLRF